MSSNNYVEIRIEQKNKTLTGRLFTGNDILPRPTLVMLHGLLGTQKNEDIALEVQKIGWNAFILNFQGSLGSNGKLRIGSQYKEVLGTIKFLTKNNIATPENIGILGYSLGSRAALFVASQIPTIKIVILLSGIANFKSTDMTDDFAKDIASRLPKITILDLKSQWSLLAKSAQPIELISKIRSAKIALIHGNKDRDVSIEHSQKMHKASQFSSLYIVKNADHDFKNSRKRVAKIITSILQKSE